MLGNENTWSINLHIRSITLIFINTLTNNFSLSLFGDSRPRTTTHIHPLAKFNLVILLTTKGEGSHTRKPGVYEIARTSPQRY
ncbi:hypothetical protein HanIR_Chr05g0224571 [Helianthus annuus]|nr:hypothetical protein HanIR_Chr05g0224571 [Helianthus annuus]